MISNERVYTVLRGEIPVPVPIGEYAVDFDTVEKVLGHETYLRAKAKSQIAIWENRQDELAQSYIEDHVALHEKLDLDILIFAQATYQVPEPSDDPPPRRVDDTTWEDKYSETTADITCVQDPVAAEKTFRPEDFREPPSPTRLSPKSEQVIEAVTQRFKGEKYIIGPNGGETGVVLLGGMERGLMELATNLEAVKAAAEYLYHIHVAKDANFIHPDHDAVSTTGFADGTDYTLIAIRRSHAVPRASSKRASD